MRKFVATAVVLVGIGCAGIAGGATGPALRVLVPSPMTVRGTGFEPAEAVTLTLTTNGAVRVRHPVASASGHFVVVFRGVTIGGCQAYVVRAVGGTGSRAVLRFIPECAAP